MLCIIGGVASLALTTHRGPPKATEGVGFMPLQHDGRDGVDVLLSNQPGAERPLPVIVVALSFSFNGSGCSIPTFQRFFNMWKKIKSNPHVKTPPLPHAGKRVANLGQ